MPEPLFADLPDLPDDLADAFEALKLAIMRHKCEGWHEISRRDVLQTLKALRDLARPRPPNPAATPADKGK